MMLDRVLAVVSAASSVLAHIPSSRAPERPRGEPRHVGTGPGQDYSPQPTLSFGSVGHGTRHGVSYGPAPETPLVRHV